LYAFFVEVFKGNLGTQNIVEEILSSAAKNNELSFLCCWNIARKAGVKNL